MSRHESPEVGAAILRMMNGLVRRAAEGDQGAIESLYVIEGMSKHFTNAALALAPYSHAELAAVTDTTRSAIQQRRERASIVEALSTCGHLACLGMRKCREARA